MVWDIFTRLGGGASSTAAQWGSIGEVIERWKQKTVPDFNGKNFVDNLTVMTGPNDRAIFFGPSMNTNFGAGFSTSFDVLGFLINNYFPATKPGGFNFKALAKAIFGSGDIKLAFGPSTSLLYGGPGGSSKRGPYWERIAGDWWDPRRKGSKYSAEGSFNPKAMGKKSGDGLQFFERDQILGSANNDGYHLSVMLKANKRIKFTPLVNQIKQGDDFVDLPPNQEKIDVLQEKEGLKDLKKDKYESDLEKCFTVEEMAVLETGDKAAKMGTILVLLVDLIAMTLSILQISKENYAGTFTSDNARKKALELKKKYEDSKKANEDADKDEIKTGEKWQSAQVECEKRKKACDDWEKDESKTSDPKKWQEGRSTRKAAYDSSVEDEKIKKRDYEDAKKKAAKARADFNEINTPEKNMDMSRDLNFNGLFFILRLTYRTIKSLTLTIMETCENTERLARLAIENKDNLINISPWHYFINQHLSLEKRKQIDSRMVNEAINKISGDINRRRDKSPIQIKEIVDRLVKDALPIPDQN